MEIERGFMIKKHSAFTLAEVLIALTVIGAVASLLIPKLIYGLRTKQAKARFNTAYSMAAEALTKMDSNNIPLKSAHYPNVADFYNVMRPYFKGIQNCGTTLCNPMPAYPSNVSSKGGFLLNNNMFVFLEDGADIANSVNAQEEITPAEAPQSVIVLTIDINGNRENPNLRGQDIFSFEIDGEDLIPVGHPESFLTGTCNHRANASIRNSIVCSYNASVEEDYFAKIYRNH